MLALFCHPGEQQPVVILTIVLGIGCERYRESVLGNALNRTSKFEHAVFTFGITLNTKMNKIRQFIAISDSVHNVRVDEEIDEMIFFDSLKSRLKSHTNKFDSISIYLGALTKAQKLS